MLNPFISVDQQLADFGYVRLQEGPWGFAYAKHLGDGYVVKAECHGGFIQFYDPSILNHDAVHVSARELELFAAKIKEWRKQNERDSKGGRHYSKKRS